MLTATAPPQRCCDNAASASTAARTSRESHVFMPTGRMVMVELSSVTCVPFCVSGALATPEICATGAAFAVTFPLYRDSKSDSESLSNNWASSSASFELITSYRSCDFDSDSVSSLSVSSVSSMQSADLSSKSTKPGGWMEETGSSRALSSSTDLYAPYAVRLCAIP